MFFQQNHWMVVKACKIILLNLGIVFQPNTCQPLTGFWVRAGLGCGLEGLGGSDCGSGLGMIQTMPPVMISVKCPKRSTQKEVPSHGTKTPPIILKLDIFNHSQTEWSPTKFAIKKSLCHKH